MPGTINARHNQCPAQSRRDWATNHQHPQSNSVPKNDAEIHGNPTIFNGFGRQNLPRLTPRRHREAGRVPGGSPEGPRGAPVEPQEPPRAPLERPKVAQGSPKGRPRSPRSSQKHPPEGKMEAETLPRSIFKRNLVRTTKTSRKHVFYKAPGGSE